jgi:hypothetical protein
MVKDDGMTEKICASDAVGCKFCVSSEDGQILYEKIKEALIGGRKVSVSFRNAVDISSAFLDSAIGQLYKGQFSEKELKEKVTFSDLSKEDSFLLGRVILRAKYYCGDPKQLDVAVCELLGEEND